MNRDRFARPEEAYERGFATAVEVEIWRHVHLRMMAPREKYATIFSAGKFHENLGLSHGLTGCAISKRRVCHVERMLALSVAR